MADIEQEVKDLLEPENLDDVDIGLGTEAAVNIAAQERLRCATEYQRLKVRTINLRASIEANKAVGSEKSASQFKDQVESLEVQLKHLLRSIKTIDKHFPGAKELQREAIDRQLREV